MQMERTQVIDTLRKEAQNDPFANAAFMVCAVRPRARFRVTLDGLKQRMVKEGFKDFDNERAARFLGLLANLGFGRLEKDAKGRVVALTDIRTTLQSIGKAALGEEVSLDKFRKRNRYTKLAEVPKAAMAAVDLKQEPQLKRPAPAPKPPVKKKPELVSVPTPKPIGTSLVGLAVTLAGRTVRIPVTEDMSHEEIALIIERFREPKRA